jgi:hypothetical protein
VKQLGVFDSPGSAGLNLPAGERGAREPSQKEHRAAGEDCNEGSDKFFTQPFFQAFTPTTQGDSLCRTKSTGGKGGNTKLT